MNTPAYIRNERYIPASTHSLPNNIVITSSENTDTKISNGNNIKQIDLYKSLASLINKVFSLMLESKGNATLLIVAIKVFEADSSILFDCEMYPVSRRVRYFPYRTVSMFSYLLSLTYIMVVYIPTGAIPLKLFNENLNDKRIGCIIYAPITLQIAKAN